jgi:hypothetical protein
MTPVTPCAVSSPRHKQSLALGCLHCGGPAGGLTQHRAGKRRGLTAPRSSVDGVGRADIARRAAFGAGAE